MNDQKRLQDAFSLFQQGKLAEAANIYMELVKQNAENRDALHYFGILKAASGQIDEAKDLIERSLGNSTANLPFVENYATILFKSGGFEEAAQLCEKALAVHRGSEGLQYLLAISLYRLGRLKEANEAFTTLLRSYPNNPAGNNEKGATLAGLLQYDEALLFVDKALRIDPEFADAYLNKGNILIKLNRYDDAVAAFDKALSLQANLPDALIGCASALRRLRRFEEAFGYLDKALTLQPDLAEAWIGRGNVLAGTRRYGEAIECFLKAQHISPELGEAHYNEGFYRLLLGDYERGWEQYEARWNTTQATSLKNNFSQPLWRGESSIANKTILLHAEQGFGDTIIASRYVPMVAALGARVILQVQAPLESLLRTLRGVSTLVVEGEDIPEFDVQCPLMSLPLAFGTRPDAIPAKVPYLTVDDDKVRKWRTRLNGAGFKVGIAWAGNAKFGDDHERSVLLQRMLPLFAVNGAKFISLQKDLRPGDQGILDANPQVIQLAAEIDDFQDTAAIMMSLDLIISTDSSVPNLAGALARPVWVLLPFNPDWRWFLDRDDSPWYPTARLFRQSQAGDWASVVDEVCEQLKRTVKSAAPV